MQALFGEQNQKQKQKQKTKAIAKAKEKQKAKLIFISSLFKKNNSIRILCAGLPMLVSNTCVVNPAINFYIIYVEAKKWKMKLSNLKRKK